MSKCFPKVWAPKQLSVSTSVISLILCIVISCGNLSIVVAVIVDPLKKLRTPFTYFLTNLAVTDLIVGLITMPLSYDVHDDEVAGYIPSYKIKLIHMSYFISATASVLSLAALTLDRYVAIRWPIRYRKRLSKLRCIGISIAIWLFSAALSTIYLETGYINYLMVFIHVSVVTTFLLLVVTYRKVYEAFRAEANELRNIQNTFPDQHKEQELRKARTEKKVTRAFLYILGLFICFYVPAIVMIYILQFCEECSCESRHILRDLQFLLVSANSAANPFVCTIRLGPFRRSIIALFRCKKSTDNTAEVEGNMGEMRGTINEGATISSENTSSA